MTKLTLQEQLIADRRHLHAHPEEGWCEFETTWFIVQRLKALGLEWKAGIDVIEPSAVMGRNADLVEKAKKRALEHGVPADFLGHLAATRAPWPFSIRPSGPRDRHPC